VQTSWALLGLMAAGCTDTDALRRGAEFLRSRQLPSGGAMHTHIMR
jgi:squalene cyclase